MRLRGSSPVGIIAWWAVIFFVSQTGPLKAESALAVTASRPETPERAVMIRAASPNLSLIHISSGSFGVTGGQGYDWKYGGTGNTYWGGIDFYASRVTPVVGEIRPVNRAVRYLIRAR